MRNTLLLLLLVTCFLFSQAQPPVEKIDSFVSAWHQNDNFSGTILVAQQGKILLDKGWGWKNLEKKEANNDKTVYQIGSVTKQFTAAIILKLAEQKKISLQDKLSKYFPELAFADKVTVEQLLSHTSGIYNFTDSSSFWLNETAKPHSQQQMIALFKDKPLGFEPGSKYSYSNSGYLLLGYIIEKITGQPYEKTVRQMIFDPLKMTNSGFDFAALRSPDKATGYNRFSPQPNVAAQIVDSTVSYAAGAIYTTAGDLYKWDRSLYTEKIISHASLNNAYTIRKSHYGLGWVIDSVYGQPVYEHDGGIFGFTSYIGRSTQQDVCIILLDNRQDAQLGEIARGIYAILMGQSYNKPAVRKEVAVDASILQQYVGEYELVPNFTIAITLENGKLKLQGSNQPKIDLFAESETRFFVKVVDASVDFVKGTDGKTASLILHQNGRDMPAKKTK